MQLILKGLGVGETNKIYLNRVLDRVSSTTEMTINDLTPSWLIKTYFFGIPLTDPRGNILPNDVISFYIGRAIDEMEAHLHIRMKIQEVDEQHDFQYENWLRYVYIRAWNVPIIEIKSAKLMIGNLKVAEIPRDWITFNKWTGEIKIIPVLPGYINVPIEKIWTIYAPLIFNINYVPDFLYLHLKVGMEVIDKLLADCIGMTASIQIFNILGDLVIGAGIASFSVSIEGLSQSIGTTASAENSAYSARIRMYQDDLKRLMPMLKRKYQVPRMSVI